MQDTLLEPPNPAGSAADFSGQNSEGLPLQPDACQVPSTSSGWLPIPTSPPPFPPGAYHVDLRFLLDARCCAIFGAYVF